MHHRQRLAGWLRFVRAASSALFCLFGLAVLALLPGCGHFLLEDAADTVVPLIFQWLRRMYLGVPHGHEEGPVTVQLGRRPPEDDRW